MIDKKLKRKIEKKEQLTSTELSAYFDPYSELPLTGLFKKYRQKQKEKKRRKEEEYGFSYGSDDESTKSGLLKSFRKQQDEKRRDSTCRYLLDNFDVVFDSLPVEELAQFLWELSRFFLSKRIIAKISPK